MSEITIGTAPIKYRSALQVADAHEGPQGSNGRIDSQEEAESAAEIYCDDNPSNCESFVKYLEGSGYASIHLKFKNSANDASAAKIADLVNKLEDKDWHVRNKAVKSLWEFAGSNTLSEIKAKMVAPLIKALTDPESEVRDNVVYALEELIKSDISPDLKATIVDPLIAAFKDTHNNDTIRSNIASALGEVALSNIPSDQKMQIVDPLMEAFENKQTNREVRRNAAFAIGDICDSDIASYLKAKMIEPLFNAIGDEDQTVRQLAIEALTSLVAPDTDNNPLVTGVADGHKSMIVDAFIKALSENDDARKESAAIALEILSKGKTPTDLKVRMIEPLILAANDKNNSIMSNVLASLRNLKRSHISLNAKKRLILAITKLKMRILISKTKAVIEAPFIYIRDVYKNLFKRHPKVEPVIEPKQEENQ